MKHLLWLCLIPLFLDARENPFKPVIDNTVLPVTSNKVEKAPPFKEIKVQLPVDARVLTSVAIYYQSIDGSIKKEIVPVDRSIDWHHPLYITQKRPGATRPVEKKVPKEAKKPEARKRVETKPTTPTVSGKTANAEAETYAPLPFVTVRVAPNRAEILTKDEKIRAFHLTNPFKVAIDFRRKAGFLTKHKALHTIPFTAIDIGNHKGYYRVVFTFDAPYRYHIIKTDDGYALEVR